MINSLQSGFGPTFVLALHPWRSLVTTFQPMVEDFPASVLSLLDMLMPPDLDFSIACALDFCSELCCPHIFHNTCLLFMGWVLSLPFARYLPTAIWILQLPLRLCHRQAIMFLICHSDGCCWHFSELHFTSVPITHSQACPCTCFYLDALLRPNRPFPSISFSVFSPRNLWVSFKEDSQYLGIF